MKKCPQFKTPAVNAAWAASRKTDIAVATAIHALSDSKRTPEQIWEDPTPAEWDNVRVAVQNYIDCGIFPADDLYQWGEESFDLK